MVPGASGRVFGRGLPQEWTQISPGIKAALAPPYKAEKRSHFSQINELHPGTKLKNIQIILKIIEFTVSDIQASFIRHPKEEDNFIHYEDKN